MAMWVITVEIPITRRAVLSVFGPCIRMSGSSSACIEDFTVHGLNTLHLKGPHLMHPKTRKRSFDADQLSVVFSWGDSISGKQPIFDGIYLTNVRKHDDEEEEDKEGADGSPGTGSGGASSLLPGGSSATGSSGSPFSIKVPSKLMWLKSKRFEVNISKFPGRRGPAARARMVAEIDIEIDRVVIRGFEIEHHGIKVEGDLSVALEKDGWVRITTKTHISHRFLRVIWGDVSANMAVNLDKKAIEKGSFFEAVVASSDYSELIKADIIFAKRPGGASSSPMIPKALRDIQISIPFSSSYPTNSPGLTTGTITIGGHSNPLIADLDLVSTVLGNVYRIVSPITMKSTSAVGSTGSHSAKFSVNGALFSEGTIEIDLSEKELEISSSKTFGIDDPFEMVTDGLTLYAVGDTEFTLKAGSAITTTFASSLASQRWWIKPRSDSAPLISGTVADVRIQYPDDGSVIRIESDADTDRFLRIDFQPEHEDLTPIPFILEYDGRLDFESRGINVCIVPYMHTFASYVCDNGTEAPDASAPIRITKHYHHTVHVGSSSFTDYTQ
jgi:hypothetical protein